MEDLSKALLKSRQTISSVLTLSIRIVILSLRAARLARHDLPFVNLY